MIFLGIRNLMLSKMGWMVGMHSKIAASLAWISCATLNSGGRNIISWISLKYGFKCWRKFWQPSK